MFHLVRSDQLGNLQDGSVVTEAKRCPLCGANIAFMGLFGVECQTVTCANAARGLPPALEPGALAWACAMHAAALFGRPRD